MLTTLYGRAGACSRRTESYTYDAIGNPLTCHNASGQGYEFTWTKGRRLKALTQGDETTTYEYTDNDLTKQTLPTGAKLTYTYDSHHNVLTTTAFADRDVGRWRGSS